MFSWSFILVRCVLLINSESTPSVSSESNIRIVIDNSNSESLRRQDQAVSNKLKIVETSRKAFDHQTTSNPSGFEHWQETLCVCCVLGEGTLLSQSLSPPRFIMRADESNAGVIPSIGELKRYQWLHATETGISWDLMGHFNLLA